METPEIQEQIVSCTENEISLENIVEALLFSVEEPLKISRMIDVAPELKDLNIEDLIEGLNESYQQAGRGFRIQAVAGGYQMFALPIYAPYIERLYSKRLQNRLSAKALETLAIIAYKQPVTRLEVEDIRGVNVDGVMRTLLSRKLITVSGTADAPGSPFLYKTTPLFLEYFGINHTGELPRLKEIDEIVEADPDLKEQLGEEILKEISPEILGMIENGTVKKDEKASDAS